MPKKFFKKKKPKVSKAIKSFVNQKIDANHEDKFIYGEITAVTLNNTTQISSQHLVLPAHGNTDSTRVGQRIKIKYIKLSIEGRYSGATTIADVSSKFQHLRLQMVRMNHTNAGALTNAGTNQGLFQTTVGGAGYSIALVNPITCNSKMDKGNNDRLYTICYDKRKAIRPLYSGQDLSAADTVGSIVHYGIVKKYPKGLYVNFTAATTGANTSVQDYTHWLVGSIGNTAVDDSGSYSYDGHYMICYEDA